MNSLCLVRTTGSYFNYCGQFQSFNTLFITLGFSEIDHFSIDDRFSPPGVSEKVSLHAAAVLEDDLATYPDKEEILQANQLWNSITDGEEYEEDYEEYD